jgi:hypothetical protein
MGMIDPHGSGVHEIPIDDKRLYNLRRINDLVKGDSI